MSGIAGWTSRVNGDGAITAETADLSPETPRQAGAVTERDGHGGSVQVSQELDAQPDRSTLQLSGAYELSFRAKGVGGNNQLTVNLARRVGGDPPLPESIRSSHRQLAQYTLSFPAADTATQSSPLQLSFATFGASIELDDVSLQAELIPSPRTPRHFATKW